MSKQRNSTMIRINNDDHELLSIMSKVLCKAQNEIIHEALEEYYKKTPDKPKTIIKGYFKEYRTNLTMATTITK